MQLLRGRGCHDKESRHGCDDKESRYGHECVHCTVMDRAAAAEQLAMMVYKYNKDKVVVIC